MKKFLVGMFSLVFVLITAQEKQKNQYQINRAGHTNESMFKQIDEMLPSPNMYRSGSGAPGPAYYQQQANYDMDIRLDEANNKIYGEQTVTYINNSPDPLSYLWVQLDQNMRAKDSPSHFLKQKGAPSRPMLTKNFFQTYLQPNFDGGFNIEYVKGSSGEDLPYIIQQTMMRINLDKPLKNGDQFVFKIKWWYNINQYTEPNQGGRSGYEHFEENDNNTYVIAQFYPRMAVYNDVRGWQNTQFWGRSEFALPFGDFKVRITVPEDHVLNGTGRIVNLDKMLTKEQSKRYKKAQKSFDKPVFIITEDEARANEKTKSTRTKTWELHAENVRDFGFSTSRKFIWDAQAVKFGDRSVMAISLYPKEGNPLWEEFSTKAVVQTLKTYSKHTFDYPYHKAISVHAKWQGMEYPMICWNYGRPNPDGTYSDRVKYGMISVIIHEIGHNYFPMIVNSDERQWTWMDEGLNSFLQFLAEQEFMEGYPSRRGFPKDIVDYMSMDQGLLMPIMTMGDFAFNFGANAYGKPSIGLSILRHTIMGPELFDFAFKEYANRWMFKHPTPADFFRTMEDASGMDLDFFWRGWFYTTEYTDIGIANVKSYSVQETENNGRKLVGFKENDTPTDQNIYELPFIKEYMQTLSAKEQAELPNPAYFYEVEYERPGGLVMPILVNFTFEDGTQEEIRYPYRVWAQYEDRPLKKMYVFEKKIMKIEIDKDQETADINQGNNHWPKKNEVSEFDAFKNSVNSNG